VLLRNLSCLFKTAQLELQRKNDQLAQLRKEVAQLKSSISSALSRPALPPPPSSSKQQRPGPGSDHRPSSPAVTPVTADRRPPDAAPHGRGSSRDHAGSGGASRAGKRSSSGDSYRREDGLERPSKAARTEERSQRGSGSSQQRAPEPGREQQHGWRDKQGEQRPDRRSSSGYRHHGDALTDSRDRPSGGASQRHPSRDGRGGTDSPHRGSGDARQQDQQQHERSNGGRGCRGPGSHDDAGRENTPPSRDGSGHSRLSSGGSDSSSQHQAGLGKRSRDMSGGAAEGDDLRHRRHRLSEASA
jgi:hypothetical protein